MKTETDIQISNLRASLKGEVIGSDDPRYDDMRRVFFTGFDRRPAAIVRVADASDVARVVTLARETGAELAVRSGGHSRAGDGTSEGGIVLDLSAMNAVEIDADGRAAWAQTGVKAGDYTRATGERGLATGLGDTASVGLGGITLGGGMGFLVRKHGLTIDDVLAAEVVTADGELLDVDEHTHPDLFWALRGGGGNFGVVTRLRLRLHEIDQVVGGMLVLPASADVITGLVAAADAAPEDLSIIANVLKKAPPLPFIRPGAARQARGDGPYGLRGRARSWVRRRSRRSAPLPLRSPTWFGRSATRRCTRGRKPLVRRSPWERTCSSMSSRRAGRRRSSRTSRPRLPRYAVVAGARSRGRDGARRRRGDRVRPPASEAHGEHLRHG